MSKLNFKVSPSKNDKKNCPAKSFVDAKHVKFETLESPTKGARDKKEYKVIKLDNGLVACLISDMEFYENELSSEDEFEDTDGESDEEEEEEESQEEVEEPDEMKKVSESKQKMAAAGLCVSVGSFSDPLDIPGMAHFLEHMVFMGSEKFPQENDFDRFISRRGGFNNASTDCETTTFYFECLEKYLYRSLDKFAQFFISPLMKRDSINREREAIESEFQSAVPNDAYRKEQLLASLFNQKVPVSQFTWGNLITLKEKVADDKLYKCLHEFRKRHYSSHRMTLCIQARLPIETLESYVLNCFHKVPNNKLPVLDFKQYSDVINDTAEFNKLYYIIPNQDTLQVDLTWSLPSLLHLYKSKPDQYVSWLLGDEGKGSLISYLRKKVWVLSIFSGVGETGSEQNSMYTYFTVTLIVTQSGLDNVFEIINAVFAYINLLKKVGPQERIFKELQLIEETSFKFAEDKSALDFVEHLAENMQYYPSIDYLTGSELCYEYKPEDIQMVMNHLRPDKMNVMILSRNMPEEIECDQLEPWFKTSYTSRDIPNKWLERWTNVEPFKEFSLPLPNQFLTTDFALLPHILNNPEFPTKLIDTNVLELWYRFDQKFELPFAYYNFYLISPLPQESPINSCMLDMFIALLSLQITEESYPAQLAELDFDFSPSDYGMQIKIGGYNEKLPVLLELITKYLKDVANNLTLEMFNAVKVKQSMSYYNLCLKPSVLNNELRLSLLLNSYWPPIVKHMALSKIDFEMMQSFANSFVKSLFIQGLIQGNLSAETAMKATQKMVDYLNCEPLLSNTLPKIRVVQLPKSEEHCCRVMSFNKNDTNSCITNYYQAGSYNIKTSCIIDLLMLIIEEPMFNILRTKEQLGYDVSCIERKTFGIMGYTIKVQAQAAKHTTKHIDARIEAFIKHIQKLLKKMTDKKINQFKRDLIKVKQCSDVLLKEEVNRNWDEIINREYVFDRIKQEIKVVEELKIGDMRKFWDEHNVFGAKSNFRKLTIQVVGHPEVDNEKEVKSKTVDGHLNNVGPAGCELNLISSIKEWKEKQADNYFISNIEKFKDNLYLYPSKTSL